MPFTNLTLSESANLLWKEGKFLNTVIYDSRKVSLYVFNGRFIEVWYDAPGDLIEKIIPMSNPDLFRNYSQES